jgi:hypothetical protein
VQELLKNVFVLLPIGHGLNFAQTIGNNFDSFFKFSGVQTFFSAARGMIYPLRDLMERIAVYRITVK